MQHDYAAAENWLAQDPDPETRAELSALLAAARSGDDAARQEIGSRFSGRLTFGTAGLRGPLQAGPSGMNRVLVAQSAAGLAAYIKAANPERPSIVIGFDARKNSERFARDSAEIMAGAGIRTLLLPRPLPTPVLAYALRLFDADAGVMITASHNPPQDNGYKVYLGKANGGGQIVPPADADIARHIDQAAAGDIRNLPRSQDYQTLDESCIDSYIRTTAERIDDTQVPLNYVYTALHGVGSEVLFKTFQAASLPLPQAVAEQNEPDGRFPTVSFPNPEEAGALDLAQALANAVGAELIIANDPDADRLAAAIPDGRGGWKILHGNTIGSLLGWDAARRAQAAGRRGTLACSLVSSPALAEIARRYGLASKQTLTGFKYIAQIPDLIYGYEEALGYLTDPEKVRDKDGISAAAAFVALACSLKKQGKTLADHIAEFEAEFGIYASAQLSLRTASPAAASALVATLRQNPLRELAGRAVQACRDYQAESPAADILQYTLADGSRLIVRPSGTEPKVKFYFDVRGDTPAAADTLLAELDTALRETLRRPEYGSQPV